MNAHRPPSRSFGHSAFTLIELLVVLSIIALLIAILLPALSAARASAEGVACMSNQRQTGLGVAMYAQEHRDHLPRPMVYNASSWPRWYSPGMLGQYVSLTPGAEVIASATCPTLRREKNTSVGFSINSMLFETESGATLVHASTPQAANMRTLASIHRPEATCVTVDAPWHNTWNTIHVSLTRWNVHLDPPGHLPLDAFRHQEGLNALHLDGRVDRMDPDTFNNFKAPYHYRVFFRGAQKTTFGLTLPD